MPGKITTEQAIHFAKALVRGQKDAAKIIKTMRSRRSPRGYVDDARAELRSQFDDPSTGSGDRREPHP